MLCQRPDIREERLPIDWFASCSINAVIGGNERTTVN